MVSGIYLSIEKIGFNTSPNMQVVSSLILFSCELHSTNFNRYSEYIIVLSERDFLVQVNVSWFTADLKDVSNLNFVVGRYFLY